MPTVALPSIDAGPRTPDSAEAGLDADSGCRDRFGGEDRDCDGFSVERGDCDDLDPQRGPAAIEIPMNGSDDDCRDGDAPDAGVPCDGELDPTSTRGADVAAALGLCAERVTEVSGRGGWTQARWLRLDGEKELGDARQVWLPKRFGRITPQEGMRMVVLSTGVARDVNARGSYTPECDPLGSQPVQDGDVLPTWSGGVSPPEGYPEDATRCQSGASRGALAYNDVGFELTLRVPSNVTGIAFDSMFFSYEYPDFVCTEFNDFFVALLRSRRLGSNRGNVVRDMNGDAIGVNSGLLKVCEPAPDRVGSKVDCSRGASELLETGYGPGEAMCTSTSVDKPDIGGAATGWLRTEVPLEPEDEIIELVFRLWDSGDPLLDSTVLLDNFRFLTGDRASEPVTVPCPEAACQ